MSEFQAQEQVFMDCLLSMYYDPSLLTPCACGDPDRLRRVACHDCVQAELCCPKCWLKKHRTMPTHWAFVWKEDEQFFQKTDFCRVMRNAVIALGHHGLRCPDAANGRSFTLVDSNGIHATAISFCRGDREPEFQQLLRAGIFPGSLKEPKTGYTLSVLELYRQLRDQSKEFSLRVRQRTSANGRPLFRGSVQ
ncbi:hypothetical protein C8R43DRAFT_910340 [Mycena crocata]|nr:hypothetical protein C8R43DRAFT_910340 [Mycena crocata]